MKLKNNLRKLIKARLLSSSGESVQNQSKFVLAELLKIDQFKHANSIGLFMSMPNVEVDTSDIIEHCMFQGKRVFLPRCFFTENGESRMEFLRMTSMDEIYNLKPEGKYNLRQPSTGTNVFEDSKLDVMIIPGVAFTSSGERLGHGAGFYDRFLSSYSERFGSSPFLIGVGLKEQLVESIPTEDHDWKMDKVVTGHV